MKDLGQAFSFPFKDPSWVSKFLIAALFMILCIVGLGFFILAGYMIQVTQRVMRREERVLPEWSDIGVKFVIGFKFAVAYAIYLIPVFLLTIPLIVLAIAGALSSTPESVSMMIFVYVFGFLLLIVPYSFALAALLPVISYRFAGSERIADALDIAGVLRDFRKHWQSTLVVALVVLAVESFAFIGIVALVVGVFFTTFYAYLVSAYLHGALYLEKTSEEIVA